MSEKPYEIGERALDFACRILEIAKELPSSREYEVIRVQIIKSGTSIGANIEEASGAKTRPDKRKTFIVARKEACETRYWLRLIERCYGNQAVKADIQEANEIIYILSAIIDKLS